MRKISCLVLCWPPCIMNSSQSTYWRSPSIFLERSLDLLWALWGSLSLRSGLTPGYVCSQSPQLLQSTVHRLTAGISLWHHCLQECIIFLLVCSHSPSRSALVWGLPLLVGNAALWCLLPTQTEERGKSWGLLGLICSVWSERGRAMVAATGMYCGRPAEVKTC